jgi:hypothetical protein
MTILHSKQTHQVITHMNNSTKKHQAKGSENSWHRRGTLSKFRKHTFGTSGNGDGGVAPSAPIPKPHPISKRATSLPDDLRVVEKSSRRLFWFIPLQHFQSPRKNLNKQKERKNNERQPHLATTEGEQHAPTMVKQSLDLVDSVTETIGILEECVDEELLGLEILESAL